MNRITTAALALALGTLAASPAGAWEYTGNPGTLTPPLDFLRLTITTPDSARLAAWFVPAQDSAGAPAPGRCPAVLVLPGDGDTMDARLGTVSALARRGFDVLTFDTRGRGQSSPFTVARDALLYPQFLEDAHAALYVLWARPEVDTTKVALYGEGMGAYLALALAGERPEVRAVVAEFPPYNPEKWLGVLKEQDPDRTYFVPKGWKRRDDPDKVVNRFNGAIFFIAGDAELSLPTWMAEDLHRRYPRDKDLWIIPGAAHDPKREPAALLDGDYYDRVASFLRTELAKPPFRGWPDN